MFCRSSVLIETPVAVFPALWFNCLSMFELFYRRPSSGEAMKKPSKPSNAAQDRPANDKKKEPDARERRRKEMMQNQV